jgi:hypothetical protein
MMKRSFAVVLSLAVLTPSAALAQQPRAGVVTTLEGNVSARRVALPGPVSLKFKDDVFMQDTVTTGDKSLARMLLGGKAVVTVRERSTLTITEVPGRSTIELEAGKFALAVAREKMRPGEEIQIRTPNAVAGVRGTVVVTEVNRQTAQVGGGAGVVTNFYVLRGNITAQPLDSATRQPLGTPLQVGTLQAYSGAGSGTPRVVPVPPEQVGQITAGLQPSGPKGGAEVGKEQVKAQAVQNAVSLLTALTGTQGSFAVGPPPAPAPPPIAVDTTAPLVALSSEIEKAQELAASAAVGTLPVSFTGSFSSGSTGPFGSLNGGFLFATDAIDIVEVLIGGDVNLSGPLATVTNSILAAIGKLLDVDGGRLTSTTPSALFVVDPSIIVTGETLINLNGGTVALAGPLLTDKDGTLVSGGEFLRLQNASTLTSTGTGALVTLDGTAVDTTAALRMSSSTMSLAGPLLAATGLSDPDTGIDDTLLPLFGLTASMLTSTGAGPLISFSSSNVDIGTDNNFVRLDSGSVVSLAGPLLEGVGTAFHSGTNTKAFSFITVLDGSSLTSTSTSPLLAFKESTVDANGGLFTVRRSASTSARSRATLAGPLLHAENSTFNTTTQGFAGQFGTANSCCSAFGVEQGGELISTTTSALVSLSGVTFTMSDANSGANMFFVADTFTHAPASELVAPAKLTLAGPLLNASSSTIKPLFGLLDVTRSAVSSTTASPLVSLSGVVLNIGGSDISGAAVAGRFVDVLSALPAGTSASPASLTLAGPLLNAVNSSLEATQWLGIFNGGSLKSTVTTPLVSLSGTQLKLNTTTVGATTFRGDFAQVSGLGGTSGSAFATMELAGGLLSVSGSSGLDMTGALLRVLAGGTVIDTHPTNALFAITGGTHAIASATGQAMFPLFGRSTATTSENVSTPGLNTSTSTLTIGTDQPLQRSGSGDLLSVSNASISTHAALTLDRALLSASAPLLNLKSGASLTTAADALNLTALAKLNVTGPLVKLDAATLTIANGHAVRAMGGSFLNVGGDLFSIANGGKLDIKNGAALFISGGSVVKINGGLVNFGGTGNQVSIVSPLGTTGGCSTQCGSFGSNILLQNSASFGNVSISSNAIKNSSGNSVSMTGGVIVLDGATSKLIISGN